MMSALDLKAILYPLACRPPHLYGMDYLDSLLSATPTDLLVTSMALSPLSTYFLFLRGKYCIQEGLLPSCKICPRECHF